MHRIDQRNRSLGETRRIWQQNFLIISQVIYSSYTAFENAIIFLNRMKLILILFWESLDTSPLYTVGYILGITHLFCGHTSIYLFITLFWFRSVYHL
jgi:hypothetical protein